ncbi:hypothetical protein, partial [Klebsiella pneumoniae]|uniref:hypothetical protein n=1 Tax=Klebsiella pneumoniae TaxID=573 RepID=UPI001952A8A5
VNAPMVMGTLSAIEMALNALNIPHGAGGVAAAIAQLARSTSADGDAREAQAAKPSPAEVEERVTAPA